MTPSFHLVLATFICSIHSGNLICNEIHLVKMNGQYMIICKERSISNDKLFNSIYTISDFESLYKINILDTPILTTID